MDRIPKSLLEGCYPMSERVVHHQGKYLHFVSQSRWEYVTRPQPMYAAFIAAITNDGCFLLTEEYRIPVQAKVIGCPAGLIGDDPNHPQETLEEGIRRELLEEAGYEAERITFLTRGPTSPGMCNEVIDIVLAEGLRKVHAGGGVNNERIDLFEIPLSQVDAWLHDQVQAGSLIDPKVYSALYFVKLRTQNEIA